MKHDSTKERSRSDRGAAVSDLFLEGGDPSPTQATEKGSHLYPLPFITHPLSFGNYPGPDGVGLTYGGHSSA